MCTRVGIIMSVSNFPCVSENVVVKQHTHVTVDARGKDLVGPPKDKQSRYWESTWFCHSQFSFQLYLQDVMEYQIPTLKD